MSSNHVTDATMRVRDVIYEGLLRRAGLQLTEAVARERANNLATAVVETLREIAEEAKADKAARAVPGQDVISDEAPPVRWPVCERCGAAIASGEPMLCRDCIWSTRWKGDSQ